MLLIYKLEAESHVMFPDSLKIYFISTLLKENKPTTKQLNSKMFNIFVSLSIFGHKHSQMINLLIYQIAQCLFSQLLPRHIDILEVVFGFALIEIVNTTC